MLKDNASRGRWYLRRQTFLDHFKDTGLGKEDGCFWNGPRRAIYARQIPFDPWWLRIFFVFLVEAMALWTIEHRLFAYDGFMKNNEFVTAVQHVFRRWFNIHRIQAVFTRNTMLRWVHSFLTRDTLTNSGTYTKLWNAVLIVILGYMLLKLASIIGKAYSAWRNAFPPLNISHFARAETRMLCTAI